MITDAHIAWIKAQRAIKRVAIERLKTLHYYAGRHQCKCGTSWPCDVALAVGEELLWGETYESR